MPRKVFFSFHFQRDSRRVAQIRNSSIIGNYDKPPFLDHTEWEKIEKQGDNAIKKWIDDNMFNTSVTIVLIGFQTHERKWVKYEIGQSIFRNNGLLGITLHRINDPLTGQDIQGQSPFLGLNDKNGKPLISTVPIYDWVNNNGRDNLAKWIEEAAAKVGR
jgi:hypothetical protein